MRAAILHEPGTPPRVEDFREPAAGEGTIVVEVLAAAVNPIDIAMAAGRFYAGTPDTPYVVGLEGVGRRGGDSPIYFRQPVHPFGAIAERCLIDEAEIVELPDGLDPALALCFGIAGSAAWLPLAGPAGPRPGETVLVLGASGTLGQVAVQAARLLGAGRVVAAARDVGGLQRARALGADATVTLDSYATAGELTAAIAEACGGGFDVAVDPLWGAPLAAALGAARPHARILQVGQSAGASVELPSAGIRGRGVSIVGHSNFLASEEDRHAAYRRMFAHALAGELTAEVERFPLEQVEQAWERQTRGAHRKVALIP